MKATARLLEDGISDALQEHEKAVVELSAALAATAAQRDAVGGTAKRERDLIRKSGLLKLSIPRSLGGAEAEWTEIFPVIRRLSAVDSSLGHLFAFHHLMMATLRFFGDAEQASRLMRLTAEKDWFWGNAVNPKDQRLRLVKSETGYRLSGEKSFCSGASDSDMLIVSALTAAW
jgi:alkylation response protein AidB-like acyl-CoA dehydrogenase